MRRVDDRKVVRDGDEPLHMPASWQIADGTADDIRVCSAHPWQSNWLIFADGQAYGTAACDLSSCIGNAQFLLFPGRKIYKIPTPLKLKSGKKFGGGYNYLVKDARGLRTTFDIYDVLLCRRA